ncbi:MAG TPA: hypothetical protein VFN46_08875 [Acetobacteraceae bacterium]|nr:hypothetical protein [Acetobacteraceae bacterium]
MCKMTFSLAACWFSVCLLIGPVQHRSTGSDAPLSQADATGNPGVGTAPSSDTPAQGNTARPFIEAMDGFGWG